MSEVALGFVSAQRNSHSAPAPCTIGFDHPGWCILGTPIPEVLKFPDGARFRNRNTFGACNSNERFAARSNRKTFRRPEGAFNECRDRDAPISAGDSCCVQFVQMLDAAITCGNDNLGIICLNRGSKRNERAQSVVVKDPM